jgi:hypothetical protein
MFQNSREDRAGPTRVIANAQPRDIANTVKQSFEPARSLTEIATAFGLAMTRDFLYYLDEFALAYSPR